MATLRVTEWNADRLIARAARILEDFGPQVAQQAREEVERVIYPWPDRRRDGSQIVTNRKNGRSVTTPRDIVDTGTLRDSATAPLVQATGSGAQLTIQWTAPYAKAVQEGNYVIGSGDRSYVAPERDWIARTYVELSPGGARPFLPYLVRRWQQLAEGGGGGRA